MRDRNHRAFTLIELLVVVAIIGILAAVGVVAYNGYTSAAKKSAVEANQKMIIKYIMSENQKCELGVASVMEGNLSCSNRTTKTILTAVQATFKDELKNPIDSSKPGICVSTDPCGNTYNYSNDNSEGVLNLHLIGDAGRIRFGTCIKAPCNGPWGWDKGKENGYIESDPPIDFL